MPKDHLKDNLKIYTIKEAGHDELASPPTHVKQRQHILLVACIPNQMKLNG